MRLMRISLVLYLLMLAAAVGLFLLIQHHGEDLSPSTVQDAGTKPGKDLPLPHVLLALAAVIVVGQVLARLLALIRQPPVIGEVLAGIVLGPSFLGEEVSGHLLPAESASYLSVIAQIGVILYMFVVGLELDLGALRGRTFTTLAVAHTGIAVPFVLGSVLALLLYPAYAGERVAFTSFALFVGVAMAITAFPVLARILTDRGLSRTPLGMFALTCAATGDATAWCLLALVVGIAKAQATQAVMVLVWTAAYLAFMLLIIHPVLSRLLPRGEVNVPRGTLAAVFAALLLSALATETIGIHSLFGAFLFGAVIPHDSAVARTLGKQLEDVVLLLLLPAFFAFTGMRTQIGLVATAEQWLLCGLIILVATLGKFGGTFAAARLTEFGWRDSAALGTLMNTRGLMELIVLNIGLDLKVISPALFAMMVLMALVTTMATAPVLQCFLPRDFVDRQVPV